MSVAELVAKLESLSRDEELSPRSRAVLSQAARARLPETDLEDVLRAAYECRACLRSTDDLITTVLAILGEAPPHASLAV